MRVHRWKCEVRLYHAGTNRSSGPDYDYELDCITNALPPNVVVQDPDGLFGTDETSTTFGGEGKVATISVYAVSDVVICKPDDPSWSELEESRVVLDDEELRIKIEISPQLQSLAQCCQMFGSSLIIKTSGTCPLGASVPIGDDASLVNSTVNGSEIRISKTRQQLISLGLLPSQDDDGVNEMSVYDVGTLGGYKGSDLSDSAAFASLAYQWRGKATNERSLNLRSIPPNAMLSKTFFKAAGCEVLEVVYGEIASEQKQIMNQADYFYYSGHGLHKFANIDDFEPADVAGFWRKDLDCVVISGCAILDINDYNNNYIDDPEDHASSPGKLWASVGPLNMLGYNHTAPQDETGAPSMIVNKWLQLRTLHGDVAAWMSANDNRSGRNACTIQRIDESHVQYGYFKRKKGYLYNSYVLTNVIERITQ